MDIPNGTIILLVHHGIETCDAAEGQHRKPAAVSSLFQSPAGAGLEDAKKK